MNPITLQALAKGCISEMKLLQAECPRDSTNEKKMIQIEEKITIIILEKHTSETSKVVGPVMIRALESENMRMMTQRSLQMMFNVLTDLSLNPLK
jgi:hypothetical protein